MQASELHLASLLLWPHLLGHYIHYYSRLDVNVATVKIPEKARKNGVFYHCVRLWKRDLIDVVETLQRAGCKVIIEDKTHSYADVDDLLSNAPNRIIDVNILGKTDDLRLIEGKGIYFWFSADTRSIFVSYDGDPVRSAQLNDHIGFLMSRRIKPLGIIFRKSWVQLVFLLLTWPVATALSILILRFSIAALIPIWRFVIVYAVTAGLFYILYLRTQTAFVRCDLWFRKNDGDDTFWKRNGDKIGLEVLKGLSAATVGGLISHYAFHHT